MSKLINRVPGLRLLISASLAMSTGILKALPGKLDIKRHEPTVVPTKSYSIVILCLQLPCKK